MSMTFPILGRGANFVNSATRYTGIQPNYLDSYDASATNVENVAVGSGTLQNFSVTLGSAPGAGTSVAFTVTKNGSDTSITATISDTATNATDTTHTVTYTQGDRLGLKIVPTSTPTASAIMFALESVASAQHMFTRSNVTQGTTRYTGMQAGQASATANLAQNVAPTAGNITACYVKLSTTPVSGNTVTYTLVINGADSAATFSIANPATTGSWSGTVALAAGDIFYWKSVATATSGNPSGWIGTEFTPTTDGESMQLLSPSTAINASGNNYLPLSSGIGTGSTTETSRANRNNTTAWTLKNLYVNLNTAPGGAASYTATVRSNAANTSITTTVTGSSTTGNDTTHTGTATSGGLLTINFVGASTPATSVVQGSYVTYLTPTASSVKQLTLTGVGV